jgi:hypothetical protein
MFNGIKIAFLVLGIAGIVSSYLLLKANMNLRLSLKEAEAREQVVRDARVKDSLAAKQLLEAVTFQRQELQDKLLEIEGVSDEEGKDYLDTAVPPSVRGVLDN